MKQRSIGCKFGNKFLGVFGYSDDLTLLCPTLSCLQEMLNVCEDFAKDYNILFNASKSKLMYFGKNNLNCENLLCMSNGSSIEFVEQCVHLGTKIYSDISKKNIDNATNDLYMRTVAYATGRNNTEVHRCYFIHSVKQVKLQYINKQSSMSDIIMNNTGIGIIKIRMIIFSLFYATIM